ncbi:MAG: galactose ABC transporter substrate-binding protein [Blautia wexlerae]
MKKKLLSVLMAAVMVAGVGGVGAAQVKADDEKILGAGIYSASDNFNSYIGKAITNACDGIFKTNIEDGQNDQSTQNNQVDTMLAKGASAVAVSVCDVTAAPTLIQKCKDAGNVPIIFFNKEITDYDVINSYENAYQVTSTGGDYGASIQAQMVIDYWKEHPEMDKNGDGKLQLVYLMGDPGHTASQPRCDYLKSTIEDAGIEIDLLAEDTGMWVTATAKEKMDAWVSKYGDEIECCVAGNDAMALGALSAVEAAGFNTDGEESSKYIPIYGLDALPEILSKIESGEITGSVLQDAKTQGQTIVKMAENLTSGKDAVDGIEGVEVEEEAKAVRVPYQAITKDNLDLAKSTYE